MKNNIIFKNPVFWIMIYSLLVSMALVIVCISYSNHECPKVEIPELTKKNIEQIKEINEATDKHTLDSLTNVLFGFESN